MKKCIMENVKIQGYWTHQSETENREILMVFVNFKIMQVLIVKALNFCACVQSLIKFIQGLQNQKIFIDITTFRLNFHQKYHST